MSVDSGGNQYATFYFDYQFQFDTVSLNYSSNTRKGLVLKQNNNGKVLWYKTIEAINTSYSVYPGASMFNSKGNLLVFVVCPSDIKVGKDTIKQIGTSGMAGYLIEFNDSGKIVNGRQLIEASSNIIPNQPSNKFVCEKNDDLSMVLPAIVSKVYDSTGTININSKSGTSNIILKFSNSGKVLKWTADVPTLYINSLKADIYGNMYAAAYWAGSSSFTFKGKTISNSWGSIGAVFIWDKDGNDKNWFPIISNKNSTLYNIAVHDSSSIFVSGNYLGDSVKVDTFWKKNRKYGTYNFLARYDINGKAKWFKTEDTSYSTTFNYFNGSTSMSNYLDKFIYTSFNLPNGTKPVIFDAQYYYPPNKASNVGMNMKVDEGGNILWGFRTGFPFWSMGTDPKDNLYFMGPWTGDTIKFGTIKKKSLGNYDVYIGKTTDYSIERGNVYAGPYCAGDTIKVPFTKKGTFDTSNYFIAELSDEFGIFDGKERELGRIKATKDTVVIGRLPFFKTASSGNYRIRIISTNPIVQSYYKFDKLRLLIYSSDKADPGPTETICYGDSIKLSTYGGTKWTWSPKYNMSDSNIRQPWAWPIRDTTYKIIIADSSGCGAPDTAVKKIIIRKPLKLTLAFNDTIVCDTSLLKLPMNFAGGDSTSYQWKAYTVTSPFNTWKMIKSGKLKLNDTLFHIPKVNITTSQKLAIVLDDQCTNKKDTAYLNISLLKPSVITKKIKDTLVCYRGIVNRKAKATYPSKNYKWQWMDITNNNILSNTDSLSFAPTNHTKIRLTLTNGCTLDTSIFSVYVNQQLKAQIISGTQNLNDTTLCFGQSLNLKSNSKGGSGIGNKFEWRFDGNLVASSDSFLMQSLNLFPKTGGIKKVILVLKDNCTPNGDTVSKIISVVESPISDFSYGTVCNRTNTDFKFTGSVPASPITTNYNWSFEGEGSTTLQNPSKLLSILGNRKVTLSVNSNNGCKDEITKTIEVKKQPKADFTFRDVCENDSAVFTNFSKDASSYSWNFGDGKESKNQDVKHKYPNVVNPKTYNVKLVALAKDGCSDSITKTISVVESPIADFSFGILCSRTITEFKFTGTKPSNPVLSTYNWNFNNEATSTLEYPSKLFSIGAKKINLKVMSNNGCSDTLTKVIEIKPQATADFLTNDVCESDSVIFKNLSTDATGYLWKFGDGQTVTTNSSFYTQKHKYQISSTTTYNVTLVSQVTSGCADSIVKAVTVNANPKSSFTFTTNQNTILFKADETATTYKWYFGNGDSATSSSQDYNYTYSKNPSAYTACLLATNVAGCISKSCKELSVTAGISSLSKNLGIKIYPNPNLGNFTVELDNPAELGSIEVYNSVGELVKKVEKVNKVNGLEIDVPDGIYLVRIKNGELIWNQKVSVSRESNR